MDKPIKFLIPTIIIIAAGSAAYVLNLLNNIVHSTLYDYGLIFDLAWAKAYWDLLGIVQILLGVIAISTIANVMLVAREIFWEKKASATRPQDQNPKTDTRVPSLPNPGGAISSIFVITGVLILALSVNFSSILLIFIGLGLVFWGAILFYVRPKKYIQRIILDKAVLPGLENIEKMLNQLDYQGSGVYLPPRPPQNRKSGLLFIPLRQQESLPRLQDVDEERLHSKHLAGIFLRPTGSALFKLIENEFEESSIKTDLSRLQERLTQLLVEDLEIAGELKIRREDNIVSVEITNHIFREICEETRKLPRTHASVGCPLCSTIACVLAKASGRPVRIKDEEQSEDGKTSKIRYSILED